MQLYYTLDLGQLILIIIGVLISIVAWFTKKEIGNLATRLDKHEDIILQVISDLAKVTGQVGVIAQIFISKVEKE